MVIDTSFINVLVPFVIIISCILNFIVAIPFINFLYKYQFYKKKVPVGENFIKTTKDYKAVKFHHYSKFLDELKNNKITPSSFGLLLILDYLIFLISLHYFDLATFDIILVIIFASLFLCLGLIDDLIKHGKYKITKWVTGLRSRYELIVQLLLTFVFIYLFDYGITYLLLLPVIIVAFSFIVNSYNIMDGLDGLAQGTAFFVFLGFLYFELRTTQDISFLLLISLIIGFLIAYLYFNVKPARVFFGDTGTMTIGFLIATLAFRYNLIASSVLLSIILFEGLSSLIQIIAIRKFNRRIFLIAPYHHHLQNKGWPDYKIVSRVWVGQMFLLVLSIFIFEAVKYFNIDLGFGFFLDKLINN